MHSWFKCLLVPAALALAGAGTAGAAPTNVGSPVPANLENTRADDGVTEVRHTYRHWRRHQARRYWRHQYRHYYRPWRYYYQGRCYWSRYYGRRICR